MYSVAAQSISKKAEEQYGQQNRRLAQKLEMTENELSNRKKEFETEKQTLYDKLHEIERERAYFKAQESSVQEKIATLKVEKEKYEKMYMENSEKSKEREGKLEKESREKISELEKRLDTVRTESTFKNSDFDKRVALLEQELQFTKRENQSLKDKCDKLEEERIRLMGDLRQKDESLDVIYVQLKITF
jgi:chromosome segregation ATPase